MSAQSLRARVRSEMIEEIKAAARKRLAVDGANLSLRGVARDMGIVASALYRYFPSRDDLLTALIMEAYRALAAEAEAADTRLPAADLRGRWMAVCSSVRDWAQAHPAEYGLLYGSPVPGYDAPDDTVAAAAAVVFRLVAIAQAGAEKLTPPPLSSALPAPVHADLRRLIEQQSSDLPEDVLDRVFVAWTQLFGLLDFEVFGRLNGIIDARADYFAHQMNVMADLVGLP
ncbi:TetR/AcrR family transcriptional regulator [Nocardia gamkensis]|uniref:TetR/AcrR family transcriptional regulator n=1 Tax=Nocardia gamkensis TaxID=352869 RepID=A0A7X6R1C5_9NOCA|nr:TetR/AcrR family transcriptional regulator [Nocardia gamkensis]NKY25135.1 TetR/AcrR family transcriptional regulator [Nocardia gamkensis]NQE70125.1 putative HTH-type transcriptional regulator [Nocardia gamkensis]